MKKQILIIFLIFIFFVNCHTSSTDNPNYKPPPVDYTNLCKNAQLNLSNLCQLDSDKNAYCCQVVSPTKLNKSFEEFCIETEQNGISLNPKCLATLTDCSKIDNCTGSK